MSLAERLELIEKRLEIAEKERDMWRARADALEAKLGNIKKRASDSTEPAPKKAASAAAPKKCSVCGRLKSECKSSACQVAIAAKKASK